MDLKINDMINLKYNYLTISIVLINFFNYSCKKEIKNEQVSNDAIAVMAYYVPQQAHPETLPLDQLTHIIFSFTKVIDNEMGFTNDQYGNKLKQLVAQRKNHPNLKVMVACGGWGSRGFSDMSYDPENRKKFVASVVEFMKTYDLDGLDVDWEYPGIPAAGTKARPEDKQNFTLLLKELREGLDTLEREQTLTFASAGWKAYYKNIEIKEVMKYADYMNVMTYDQIGGGSPYTAHHTPLGWIKGKHLKGPEVSDFYEEMKKRSANFGVEYEPGSVEMIIDYCISQGVSPKQLVVGAAFYGRSWKGVGPANNGLYQANKGDSRTHIYKEIRALVNSDKGYQKHWDSIAKAPYLYNPTDSIFMTYDDTKSVKLKTEYVIKSELGGIMFWQLSQDTKDENSLVNAIYEASKEK